MIIVSIGPVICPKCDWEYQPTRRDPWISNDEMRCRCEKCRETFYISPLWSVGFSCYNDQPENGQLIQ